MASETIQRYDMRLEKVVGQYSIMSREVHDGAWVLHEDHAKALSAVQRREMVWKAEAMAARAWQAANDDVENESVGCTQQDWAAACDRRTLAASAWESARKATDELTKGEERGDVQ